MCRRRQEQVITTIELAGNCMLLLWKVLRSLLFNILVFILGFSVAYVYVVTIVHKTAIQHDSYEFVRQIENDVQQQRQLCRKIEGQLKVYKVKLSHDIDPVCDDTLSKPLVSKEIKQSHQ